MKNLNKFKVQELEQRLEMKKWTASAGTSTDYQGRTTINTSVGVTW